jgi:predicted DNA-binding transcriptional regulator YafY
MPAGRRLTIQTEGLVDQERLRQIVEVLRESPSPGPTRVKIARELGNVSLRTVDRAIALLEAQGARIDRIRTGNPKVIHFKLTKGPIWDEHVTSEARLALRLASLSLTQCGTHLWQEKLGVIEALASERMSHRDRRLFEQLQRCIRLQGGVEDPIETSEVLEPLLQALENGREIEVEYQAAGAKAASGHQVVPYALTHDLYSGGAFLLVWDYHRKKPIHLRLSRIAKVKILGRTGVIPDLELMERAARYQIGGWTSEQEPFEVEVRIEGAHWVQALKEAPPALPDFGAVASMDGQSMIVKFKANHENGPTRWILQFGMAAEVVSPTSLRLHVAEQLEKASCRYSNPTLRVPQGSDKH